MLAVASDRFPRTGAIAISIMGGIGMLSAGLIGAVFYLLGGVIGLK